MVINQFNATIGQWTRYLDDYTQAMLCEKPQPGSWSVGQVYVHIIDDTSYFMEQVKACLLNDANRDQEMHEDAKAIFANNGFPDILLLGPSATASIRQPGSKDELLQNLLAIKEEANKLYSSPGFLTSKGKTRHPGLGFFSAAEWLRFAEMHLRHHYRQKNRIDDALGFSRTVLVLGANSDVAKEAILLYVAKGYRVIAASRSTAQIASFLEARNVPADVVTIRYFDATAFDTHKAFYAGLPAKPRVVLYAAGFQVENEAALLDWEGSYRMMNTHYAGAVSILNLIAMDTTNGRLERIIGLSSLSGVRGRKSNFIYGSTKAAFTQYLAGLRQYLFTRKIMVNVIVAGYIRSKMTAGLWLPESLLMEPAFIARAVVNAGKGFTIVPGFKWKLIYRVLKALPERFVAKLP